MFRVAFPLIGGALAGAAHAQLAFPTYTSRAQRPALWDGATSALAHDGVTERIESVRVRPSALWSAYVALAPTGDAGRAAIVINDGKNGWRVACVDRDDQACRRRLGG